MLLAGGDVAPEKYVLIDKRNEGKYIMKAVAELRTNYTRRVNESNAFGDNHSNYHCFLTAIIMISFLILVPYFFKY